MTKTDHEVVTNALRFQLLFIAATALIAKGQFLDHPLPVDIQAVFRNPNQGYEMGHNDYAGQPSLCVLDLTETLPSDSF